MTYNDIKDKLPKATQFITVKISYRSRKESPTESLLWDAKMWLEQIRDGKHQLDDEGRYPGCWMMTEAVGDKQRCQNAASEARFYRQAYGSTSRVVQLGLWKESWRVLPADEKGCWVPSANIIKKALETL